MPNQLTNSHPSQQPHHPAPIQIAKTVLNDLQHHMNTSPTTEVCGILLGKVEKDSTQIHSYRKLHNVAPNPEHHFQLDPYEWVQCCYQEPDLIGLFHSHPHSAPVPSQEDLTQLPNFADLISIYVIGSPYTPNITSTNAYPAIQAYTITRQSQPNSLNATPSHRPYIYTLLPAQLSPY